MEKGESWYGLFDTMVDSKTEVCLSLACFFHFLVSFVQVSPNFCGMCPSSSPLWKRRMMSVCVCRLVR